MCLLLGAPGAASADSDNDVIVASPITQTHTLFFNTQFCSGPSATGYAFINWNERMQRTPGANREIDHARYRAAISGVTCAGNTGSSRDTGVATYLPAFDVKNDITWTLTLSWPMIVPVIWGSASSQRVSYTRRGGGPVLQSMCNNIQIANNGDYCSQL
jgi:hypothetical protein